MTTKYRDYTFLGTTQSLCPACLELVPAKIVERGGRVYFRKHCREHGPREDFVCSDVRWWDRVAYSLPGKTPREFGVEPRLGCPYDCGLCTEHEQHTCIGLLEINSACNLECPMCFASSGPVGEHLSFEDCRRAIDRLVEVEGRPEILQLSGGEPTIHPQFLDVWRYACDQPIDIVMINTNGIRLAHDPELVAQLAERRQRTEIYLQFDGFDDGGCRTLRGESLVETKLRAVERLGAAGVRTILVCTVQPGVNDHELGRLVEFGVARPHITGISFQPACYVGRHVLPAELARRVTFPDVIRGICEQTGIALPDGERLGEGPIAPVAKSKIPPLNASRELPPSARSTLVDRARLLPPFEGGGAWRESDFAPLPCAHPNAHTLAYAYRSGGACTPLARFVDLDSHLDLLSGRITFNRERARELIGEYLSRMACGGADCGCGDPAASLAVLDSSRDATHRRGAAATAGAPQDLDGAPLRIVDPRLSGKPPTATGASSRESDAAQEFFRRALAEDLAPEDVFRITTTSFMDAYNFDVRQEMKACVHFVLPSGHIIPFSAYNLLYRDRRVPLPELKRSRQIPSAAAAGSYV